MALHKLNDITTLKDPLKKFQVKFTISMAPGLSLAIAQQKGAGLISGNSDTVNARTLELRCTSFDYPGTKIGQTDLVKQDLEENLQQYKISLVHGLVK